jgi:hypothetical protein
VRDHRTGVQKLKRIREIVNGKIQPPPTVEGILAAEEKRLGVKLEIKKEEK